MASSTAPPFHCLIPDDDSHAVTIANFLAKVAAEFIAFRIPVKVSTVDPKCVRGNITKIFQTRVIVRTLDALALGLPTAASNASQIAASVPE